MRPCNKSDILCLCHLLEPVTSSVAVGMPGYAHAWRTHIACRGSGDPHTDRCVQCPSRTDIKSSKRPTLEEASLDFCQRRSYQLIGVLYVKLLLQITSHYLHPP